MNLFVVHLKRQPDCPFVHSIVPTSSSNVPTPFSSPTTTTQNSSISTAEENTSKRQKIETMNFQSVSNTLLETDSIQQVRRRTFSHWPHRTVPSSAQMIEAGFFNCNVDDRVICIYCNLICQQWIPHTDDPCELHKTLSPNCIYVKTRLMHPIALSIIIVNESTPTTTTGIPSSISNNLSSLRPSDIVFRTSCNPAYSEIPKRHASFATWPNENLPSVDNLVRAGFFFTGKETIVTCFYCNGSLQNWGSNDNPMIEHARWFPYCAYARQLCGEELYHKIQDSKRIQQERARATELKEKTDSNNLVNTTVTANSRRLLIPDESTLSRLVAARLDLSISQRLLNQNFKLSIIKRCWEDQLRIKHDDFVSDCDLYAACLILQKQIEHIDGKKENIIIPSIKMKQIREQNETRMREPISTIPDVTQFVQNHTDVNVTISSQSLTNESTFSQSSINSTSKSTNSSIEREPQTNKQITTMNNRSQSTNSEPSNLCVLCLTEEKQLACIPCGHMATCVACGHSLRLCPICRREIDAFIRIYT
ncbi:unnamed protein product [Rotaria sordida]|uniref:RING-type domain-containing protein n=1 Tax=Rotaria sordida TaxID=392033 RepID=A0A818YWX9_9BILA|nr:unnamed protein product [Rotaria sordida]CAF1117457.1 unnamed protein product [Rotaria sordida]CAF3508480.1 unnamed protein product [Rotaria sordida]CAF3762493.1 unnamed protein product [Rotaria sordida]